MRSSVLNLKRPQDPQSVNNPVALDQHETRYTTPDRGCKHASPILQRAQNETWWNDIKDTTGLVHYTMTQNQAHNRFWGKLITSGQLADGYNHLFFMWYAGDAEQPHGRVPLSSKDECTTAACICPMREHPTTMQGSKSLRICIWKQEIRFGGKSWP